MQNKRMRILVVSFFCCVSAHHLIQICKAVPSRYALFPLMTQCSHHAHEERDSGVFACKAGDRRTSLPVQCSPCWWPPWRDRISWTRSRTRERWVERRLLSAFRQSESEDDSNVDIFSANPWAAYVTHDCHISISSVHTWQMRTDKC